MRPLETRRRREFRRLQRRDAGRAFVGVACLFVAILAGLAWLLFEIPNFGLGG